MQRTRLATLLETATDQLRRWLFNPWRRVSLVVIGLLFGNFFGVAIAAFTGQAARQDIAIAALLVLLVELISWRVYRRSSPAASTDLPLRDILNAFKIGLTYALFVEAFKLGS